MSVFETIGPKLLCDGKELQLHGVNLIGMEGPLSMVLGLWSNHSIEDFLDKIKALKFNCVRLPIGPNVIKNVALDPGSLGVWPGSKNESKLKGFKALDLLDYLIGACEARGIFFYFDMHYLKADGGIPALWYTPEYHESQWISDMAFLAKRYKGKKGFVGIDTKNEPGEGKVTWGTNDPATDWRAANERAWNYISKFNTDIVLMIETTNAKGSVSEFYKNPPNIPANKVVYSRHQYFNDVWAKDGWSMPGLSVAEFPASMPPVWDNDFGNCPNACVMIGEWGGKALAGSRDRTAQEAFVNYLKAKGIVNHTYWCFQPDSWDTGGILIDGNYEAVDGWKVANIDKLRTDKAWFSNAQPSITPPIVIIDKPNSDRPTILDWFKFDHLPTELQDISAPFGHLAEGIYSKFKDKEQGQVALQKLLEAKDAAVRACK